jgi:alanine racemase
MLVPLMVTIYLDQIRDAVASVARRSQAEVLAVVKADAYGLGAARVIQAVDELVAGYYVFHPREVLDARLHEQTRKSFIAAVPEGESPSVLREARIRPGVWTAEQASRYAGCDPVLCVDTGMQRFACAIDQIEVVLASAPIREAFTHASRREQAVAISEHLRGRGIRLHAAGSALIDDPACTLDAVRPGLALYRDAVAVNATLVDARPSQGPVGYGGFFARRHGVILAGYSHGLRRGPCVVNGRRQQILEVGMQSAYVSLDQADRAGDAVTLLGRGLSLEDVAQAWNASPHEALLRLVGLGPRTYVG